MKYSLKVDIFYISLVILLLFVLSIHLEIKYVYRSVSLISVILFGYCFFVVLLGNSAEECIKLPIVSGFSIFGITFLAFFVEFFRIFSGFSYIMIFRYVYIITFLLLALMLKVFKRQTIINVTFDIPTFVISFLLLFLSIYGSVMLYYTNTYLVLFGFFVLLIILVIYFSEYNFDYDIILYFMFLSILLSETLTLKVLSWHSGDAALEYYFGNKVLSNNLLWISTLPDNRNSMLSIISLEPGLSILLDLPLIDIFKYIYPAIYAFSPVVIYYILQSKSSRKFSFLVSLLYIVFPFSYLVLSHCSRQGFSMYALSLFLYFYYISIHAQGDAFKYRLVYLIFLSLVFLYHYATAYLITFVLFSVAMLWYILYNSGKLINTFLYFLVSEIFWYSSFSSSRPFISLVKTLYKIIHRKSLMSSSYTLYALSKQSWSFSVEVTKYIILIISLFIVLGVFDRVRTILKVYKFNTSYTIIKLIIFSFSLILALTVLPTKGIFSTPRVYPLVLLVTSSVVYFGIVRSFRTFKIRKYKAVLLLVIVLLFFFGYGIFSEIVGGGDYSPNVILSIHRSNRINSSQFDRSLYDLYFNMGEYYSSSWLIKNRYTFLKIYLDPYAEAEMVTIIGPNWVHKNPPLVLYQHVQNKDDVKSGYIYLRTYNIKKRISVFANPPRIQPLFKVYPLHMSNVNLIYNNIYSRIYLKK